MNSPVICAAYHGQLYVCNRVEKARLFVLLAPQTVVDTNYPVSNMIRKGPRVVSFKYMCPTTLQHDLRVSGHTECFD